MLRISLSMVRRFLLMPLVLVVLLSILPEDAEAQLGHCSECKNEWVDDDWGYCFVCVIGTDFGVSSCEQWDCNFCNTGTSCRVIMAEALPTLMDSIDPLLIQDPFAPGVVSRWADGAATVDPEPGTPDGVGCAEWRTIMSWLYSDTASPGWWGDG
jgi:hypothetical protein